MSGIPIGRRQLDSLQFLKIGSMKDGLSSGKYNFPRTPVLMLSDQSCFSSGHRETITPIFRFLSCWFTA